MTSDVLTAGIKLADQTNQFERWIAALELQGRVKTVRIEARAVPDVSIYALDKGEFLLGESIRAFALSQLQCQAKVLRRQFEELGCGHV